MDQLSRSRIRKSPTITIDRGSQERELAGADDDMPSCGCCMGDGRVRRDRSGVEVRMNNSARNIVYSAEGRQSALLDVTVFKPNLDAVPERNVLTTAQVKEFLVSLHKQRMERDGILPRLLDFGDERKREAVVQIATHKPFQRQSASQDSPPPSRDHARIRRRPLDGSRDRRKGTPASPGSRGSDQTQDRRRSHLKDIRESVDPLFVGLKESLRNVEARITAMQENIEPPPVQVYVAQLERNAERVGDVKNTQHVYRTTPGSREMKAPLGCQTKYGDGPEKPCMCQHCGMMGLLSEQQKYPIVSHAPEPKELLKKQKQQERAKSTNEEDRYMTYLQNLAERVRILEDRLNVQEERSVPKDYFKRVITKIVSHFSAKTARIQSEIPTLRQECRRRNHAANEPTRDSNCCNLGATTQYNQQSSYFNTPFTTPFPTPLASNYRYMPSRHGREPQPATEDVRSEDSKKKSPSQYFWKWGEEILRPGIDLKNKIMSLLEVTLRKLRSSSRTTHQEADENRRGPEKDDLRGGRRRNLMSPANVNDDYNYYYATRDTPQEYPYPHDERVGPAENRHVRREENRHFNVTYADCSGHRYMKQSMIPPPSSPRRDIMDGRGVDVAYLNPNISAWREESSVGSIRMDVGEECSRTNVERIREAERREFLRALSHTRGGDRQRLWQSIWNQAQLNGQTKADKVTIQIPKFHQKRGEDSPAPGDIVEVEFTIGDLEAMLTGGN